MLTHDDAETIRSIIREELEADRTRQAARFKADLEAHAAEIWESMRPQPTPPADDTHEGA